MRPSKTGCISTGTATETPPADLTAEQREAWDSIVAELPPAVEVDRATLLRAVKMRAELIAGIELSPFEMRIYSGLLVALFVPTGDQPADTTPAGREQCSGNSERRSPRRDGPNVDAAMAALNLAWEAAPDATTAALILIEAAQGAAMSASVGGEMETAEARHLFNVLETARAVIGLRAAALDLFPVVGTA